MQTVPEWRLTVGPRLLQDALHSICMMYYIIRNAWDKLVSCAPFSWQCDTATPPTRPPTCASRVRANHTHSRTSRRPPVLTQGDTLCLRLTAPQCSESLSLSPVSQSQPVPPGSQREGSGRRAVSAKQTCNADYQSHTQAGRREG